MSYAARVFRVLIASPSDVSDERDIAVNAIQAWNDLNSSERQIVLLPVRWETHAAPEYGRRPQEVINRQIVDHCDLLVGIFWTRVGSPTGAAESGTLEEIERVAKQGKPVMLYFSRAKQDPDRIDIDQLGRLREFKKQTFPKALVEHYSGQVEFRDKLFKQLEIKIRALLAEENQSEGKHVSVIPRTEVQFEFAEPQSGKPVGHEVTIQSRIIQLEDWDQLPDHDGESKGASSSVSDLFNAENIWSSKNKHYYREMTAYLVRQSVFRPVRFWLKNVGGVGARDLYIDLRVSSNDCEFTVVPLTEAKLSAPSPSGSLFTRYRSSYADTEEAQDMETLGTQRTTYFELRALQPQREISPKSQIAVGAKKSGTVEIAARIYADSLSEPVLQTLRMKWAVETTHKTALEALQEAGIEVRFPNSKPRAVQ